MTDSKQEKVKTICSVDGCDRKRANKGRTKTGRKKLASKCNRHIKAAKLLKHTNQTSGVSLGYKGNSLQSFMRKY